MYQSLADDRLMVSRRIDDHAGSNETPPERSGSKISPWDVKFYWIPSSNLPPEPGGRIAIFCPFKGEINEHNS
jgi:hypothetical protein